MTLVHVVSIIAFMAMSLAAQGASHFLAPDFALAAKVRFHGPS
ncbi:hypothetical protein [uncultured Tateyamaria sp.]|nr:hypothetical protein [uncultured Tateyamaria sp.]